MIFESHLAFFPLIVIHVSSVLMKTWSMCHVDTTSTKTTLKTTKRFFCTVLKVGGVDLRCLVVEGISSDLLTYIRGSHIGLFPRLANWAGGRFMVS